MIANDAFQGHVPFGPNQMAAVRTRLQQLADGHTPQPMESQAQTVSIAHVLSVSPSLGWMAAIVPMSGDQPSHAADMQSHQTTPDQADAVVNDVYDHVDPTVLNHACAFIGSLMAATGFTDQLVPLMALYAVYAHDDQAAARWMVMAHDLDLTGDPILQAAERLAKRHNMQAAQFACRNRVDAVVTNLLELGELDYTDKQHLHAFTLANTDTLADMMANCDQDTPGEDDEDEDGGNPHLSTAGPGSAIPVGRRTDIFFNHDGMTITQLRLMSLTDERVPSDLGNIIRLAECFTSAGTWQLMADVMNWCRSNPCFVVGNPRPMIFDDALTLEQFYRMHGEDLQAHSMLAIIIDYDRSMEGDSGPAFHLVDIKHVATIPEY